MPVWLSHPHSIHAAENKVAQLQMARSAGFEIPETLITNQRDEIRAFSANHFHNITPCIFQKYIDKMYEIRVTVVGSQVFAARVDSQSHAMTLSDWRREKLPFVAYELPENVASICVDVVKRFNLTFSAIDLIKTPDGRYIFLELNPNGQWAWVEKDTGLPISEHIINYLMQANV